MARSGTLDRLAIGLSGLCFVHCVASAIFVATIASVGGALLDPRIHEVGMMLAVFLGIFGLGRGVRIHGLMLPAAIGGLGLGIMSGALTLDHHDGGTLYSIIGVLTLALGHDLNRRAVI